MNKINNSTLEEKSPSPPKSSPKRHSPVRRNTTFKRKNYQRKSLDRSNTLDSFSNHNSNHSNSLASNLNRQKSRSIDSPDRDRILPQNKRSSRPTSFKNGVDSPRTTRLRKISLESENQKLQDSAIANNSSHIDRAASFGVKLRKSFNKESRPVVSQPKNLEKTDKMSDSELSDLMDEAATQSAQNSQPEPQKPKQEVTKAEVMKKPSTQDLPSNELQAIFNRKKNMNMFDKFENKNLKTSLSVGHNPHENEEEKEAPIKANFKNNPFIQGKVGGNENKRPEKNDPSLKSVSNKLKMFQQEIQKQVDPVPFRKPDTIFGNRVKRKPTGWVLEILLFLLKILLLHIFFLFLR